MQNSTRLPLSWATCAIILCSWLWLPGLASASEVLAAKVVKQDDSYQLYLKMRIDAPYEFVYESLTDYANIRTLSQSIVESIVLEFKPPRYRIKLVSEGCVWFICRTVTQVQDVHEIGNGQIKIRVVPEQSDIRQSLQHWQIEADKSSDAQARTVVSYRATIEPDFWIPPLVGSWIFQERLLDEGQTILNSIEHNASDDESSD